MVIGLDIGLAVKGLVAPAPARRRRPNVRVCRLRNVECKIDDFVELLRRSDAKRKARRRIRWTSAGTIARSAYI